MPFDPIGDQCRNLANFLIWALSLLNMAVTQPQDMLGFTDKAAWILSYTWPVQGLLVFSTVVMLLCGIVAFRKGPRERLPKLTLPLLLVNISAGAFLAFSNSLVRGVTAPLAKGIITLGGDASALDPAKVFPITGTDGNALGQYVLATVVVAPPVAMVYIVTFGQVISVGLLALAGSAYALGDWSEKFLAWASRFWVLCNFVGVILTAIMYRVIYETQKMTDTGTRVSLQLLFTLICGALFYVALLFTGRATVKIGNKIKASVTGSKFYAYIENQPIVKAHIQKTVNVRQKNSQRVNVTATSRVSASSGGGSSSPQGSPGQGSGALASGKLILGRTTPRVSNRPQARLKNPVPQQPASPPSRVKRVTSWVDRHVRSRGTSTPKPQQPQRTKRRLFTGKKGVKRP